MLESFVPNDKIVLKKNPNYYDAANVKIDEVQWLPFEDRSACLRRFEAGEVLICADVPAEQMTYMKEKLPEQLRIAPYLGAYYLPVKVGKEKFADPRVRQAISMLIDRDFIANEVWQGTMLPAYALVPPGIDNYVADAPELDYADMDLLDREDKALELFEEAGVDPATLEIQLSYNSSENHRNTMAAVADNLSNVGIKSTLNEMEGTNYFNYLREGGDFDIVRAGWIGDYSDPQNFLYLNESGRFVQLSRLVERRLRLEDARRRRDHRPRRAGEPPRRGGEDLPGRGALDPDPLLLLPRARLRQGRGLRGQHPRRPLHALADDQRSKSPAADPAAGPPPSDRRGNDADLHAQAAGERHPDDLHHHHADLLHDPRGARRAVRPGAAARSR